MLEGEAVDVARAFSKYWSSVRDGKTVVRPGLDLAVSKEKPGRSITARIGEEILALRAEANRAHTAYRIAIDPGVDVYDRATELPDEIGAALEYFFDDGVEDERDAQLAAVRPRTSPPAPRSTRSPRSSTTTPTWRRATARSSTASAGSTPRASTRPRG